MSLGLVLRDINLGTSNQINGTPTLFINGHRLQGVSDSFQLSQLITEARKGKLADDNQVVQKGDVTGN